MGVKVFLAYVIVVAAFMTVFVALERMFRRRPDDFGKSNGMGWAVGFGVLVGLAVSLSSGSDGGGGWFQFGDVVSRHR